LGYNTYIHGSVTRKLLCSYLKQAKMSFSFCLQNQRTEGQTRSCLRGRYQWEGEEVGKGDRRVNVVQILFTHVWKGKNDTC
jgi:hypothetical protein